MATKKAASTKKATAKKPAAAKTTVRTLHAEARPAKVTKVAQPAPKTVVRPVTPPVRHESKSVLPTNIINVVFAELVGTFILTLAAVLPFSVGLGGVNGVVSAIGVGLTLAVLVVTLGAVSGAHFNPAVTFALWTMRRLRAVLLPFYWGAQFLGAMLAVIVINWVSNNSLGLSFNHIWNFNWAIFAVELVGTAVFLFGLAAAVSRRELTVGARALAIGASLALGAIISSSLLTSAISTATANYQKAAAAAQQDSKATSQPTIPYVVYVRGATLNPAVSLASTEKTQSELSGTTSDTKEATYSRFTLEVVLGTLLGAAVGGNLYLLIAGRNKND